MHFREYHPDNDRAAVHRIWHEVGWLEKGKEEAVDLFLADGRTWVAELQGQPECVVQTAPGTITVTADGTQATADLMLLVPQPVVMEDGSTPRVLEVAGADPAAGLGVTVTGTGEQVAIAFAAAPAEAAISLRAYPGSGEVALKTAHVTYTWQDAGGREHGLAPVATDLAPVTVPAATMKRFGEPVTVKVPLAAESLKQAFAGAAMPETVTATITFSMADGQVAVDRVFDQLRARVLIRRQ